MREKILEKLSGYLGNELLFEEGLFQRLLERIQNCGTIGAMDLYEKNLRKEHSDAVRDFYYRYLQSAAEGASDRNMYRGVMQYLKKLAGFPGGKSLAEALAATWRQRYSRRSAMLDELQKAGF